MRGSPFPWLPARFRALRDLMPDASYVPARLAPGVGLLAVTCLEYTDTDVGPYNELLIGVPLNEPPVRVNVPGRALMGMTLRRQQHSFVWQLPVTTDVALRGGVDFYNFPKFIATIDFDETAETLRCRLAEGREHILTLAGERIAAPRSARIDHFLRLWMDGEPQTGHFRMNQLQVGTTRQRTAAVLELGERHPIARELDRLLLSHRPLQYEYCPRLEAILFGPEHLTLPLLERGLRAAAALERRLTNATPAAPDAGR